MRCYICDRVIEEPSYNQDYESYDPCEPCLRAIEDLLDDFKDKPSQPEDDYDVAEAVLYSL